MNLLIGTILLFTLFLLLLLLAVYLKNRNQGKKLIARLGALDGFKASQFIMGQQSTFLLAVDKSIKEVAYLNEVEDYVFPFNSIISVELLKDGKPVSEYLTRRLALDAELSELYDQNKTHQFFGGDKGKGDKVNSTIKVRIGVVGHKAPLDVVCFDAKTLFLGGARSRELTSHDSQLYRRGLQIAQHLMILLEKIITQVDVQYAAKGDSTAELNSRVIPTPALIADELIKLSELKDKGVLSAEEFEAQKKRLLESTEN